MAGFTASLLRFALAAMVSSTVAGSDGLGGCDGCASSASLLATKATTSQVEGLSEVPIDMTEGVGSNTSNNTNQSLENILMKNLEHDLTQADSIPSLESNSSSNGTHGFGSLGANLEFMMLKLAQLETIVELQQLEIHELKQFKLQHMAKEHNVSTPKVSMIDKKAQDEAKTKKAQEVLKKVLRKHNHQRDRKEYVRSNPSEEKEQKEQESSVKQELLERQIKEKKQETKTESQSVSLDNSVSSKIPIIDDAVDVITDGTGMIGDALGDAYDAAEDQVSFVADTVIDSVEMAVDILIRGFSDWSAGCDDSRFPSLDVDGNGLEVDWGRQRCWVRLMGQTCQLFDFNFGTQSMNWPEPLKTVTGFGLTPIKAIFTMGKELVDCALLGTPVDVMKCFGYKLIGLVPPLSFLNRMGDILTEFIEIFGKVAATIVKQALDEHQNLLQQAATSKFPAAGAPPVVHHASKSLTIKTHSQHPGSSFGSKARNEAMSTVQKAATEGDDDPSATAEGAISFGVGDQEGNYATKLITQFNGKELDTSSCLAFAPKNKHGSNGQATQADWQVNSNDDFIQLEPWAVPCDNSWMKDNWNKWQGYSFYTWEMSIEKCVTVSFSLGMQPALSFVGGLEFDLLPAPLAQLDTIVCWPDKQPGGVDLSVLRTEIRSGGILLFSRTLRLTQRFGGSTDFVNGNTFGAHETWRNPIGIATGSHSVEDDRTLEPISRTASLLQNETEKMGKMGSAGKNQQKQQKTEVPSTHWQEKELYLASIDYGKHLGINKTFELHGSAAKKRMGRTIRRGMSTLQAGKSEAFQLFSFKNPGLVSFEIEGLLEDNCMDLGVKINFGPFESPTKRIRLVNIEDQFSMVLAAMPFVSAESKTKAILSLKDFTHNDVQSVVPVAQTGLTPGSTIALRSAYGGNKFVRMNGVDLESNHAIGDSGRFTVVDAGNGELALHNAKWNRFVRMNSDGDMDSSGHKAASALPPAHQWTHERFTVLSKHGKIALHNAYWNRYMRMLSDGTVDCSAPHDAGSMPDGWKGEWFTVVPAPPRLEPGSVVAFHSKVSGRFLRLNGDSQDMDQSGEKEMNQFPPDWWWERFTVVDAGNGEVALHSAHFNRFVKVGEGCDPQVSGHVDANALPDNWARERFAVVPAGDGVIALHSAIENRFLRMRPDGGVDCSGSKDAGELPGDWTWERFELLVISSFSTDDSTWSFS